MEEKEGVLEQVLGQLAYNILSTLKLNGFERNEIITESWLRAYRALFPTLAHANGVIGWAKGFATGAHQFETPDAATKGELAGKPALAIWGEADRTLHAKHLTLVNQRLAAKCANAFGLGPVGSREDLRVFGDARNFN